MNDFQTVESGQGMLKDYYDEGKPKKPAEAELSEAIKKRKVKLELEQDIASTN